MSMINPNISLNALYNQLASLKVEYEIGLSNEIENKINVVLGVIAFKRNHFVESFTIFNTLKSQLDSERKEVPLEFNYWLYKSAVMIKDKDTVNLIFLELIENSDELKLVIKKDILDLYNI